MHAFPQVVIFQARGVLSTQVMQSGKKKQEQKKNKNCQQQNSTSYIRRMVFPEAVTGIITLV